MVMSSQDSRIRNLRYCGIGKNLVCKRRRKAPSKEDGKKRPRYLLAQRVSSMPAGPLPPERQVLQNTRAAQAKKATQAAQAKANARKAAAIQIQACCRGVLARRQAIKIRAHIVKVQAVARGHRIRERSATLQSIDRAVQSLQRAWRKYQLQKQQKARSQKARSQKANAVTTCGSDALLKRSRVRDCKSTSAKAASKGGPRRIKKVALAEVAYLALASRSPSPRRGRGAQSSLRREPLPATSRSRSSATSSGMSPETVVSVSRSSASTQSDSFGSISRSSESPYGSDRHLLSIGSRDSPMTASR